MAKSTICWILLNFLWYTSLVQRRKAILIKILPKPNLKKSTSIYQTKCYFNHVKSTYSFPKNKTKTVSNNSITFEIQRHSSYVTNQEPSTCQSPITAYFVPCHSPPTNRRVEFKSLFGIRIAERLPFDAQSCCYLCEEVMWVI